MVRERRTFYYLNPLFKAFYIVLIYFIVHYLKCFIEQARLALDTMIYEPLSRHPGPVPQVTSEQPS